MTDREKQQLDDTGFVVLPDFMGLQLLADLRRRVAEVFAEEGNRAGSEFKQEPGCRRLANCVLEEYARACGQAAEDFLDKKAQVGVRVVYVSTKEGREIDRSVLLVRINGVQERVVGVGHHPSTKK